MILIVRKREKEMARNVLHVKGESWPSGSSMDQGNIRFTDPV